MTLREVRVLGSSAGIMLPPHTPVDIPLLDLQDAYVHLREELGARFRNVRLCQAEHDVFLGKRPVYPSLLSTDPNLALSPSEFIQEVRLVLEARDTASIFGGAYIYRVLVTEPSRLVLSEHNLHSPIGRHAAKQLRNGYLMHDVLYGTEPASLTVLLSDMIADATRLQVSLCPDAGLPSEIKTVQLTSSQAPERQHKIGGGHVMAR